MDLIAAFGTFTTEVVWFDEGLRRVMIYPPYWDSKGISGISVQTSTGTYSIGCCDSKPAVMILDTPDEKLTGIDVRTSIGPSAFILTVSLPIE